MGARAYRIERRVTANMAPAPLCSSKQGMKSSYLKNLIRRVVVARTTAVMKRINKRCRACVLKKAKAKAQLMAAEAGDSNSVLG
ncbi:hypothetical protein NDU88_005740 [Pleurodeles waltl]|uniref:60S ribosomal protein L34 n=1 Tax=Pleurodeles waltl TaxID=8319 RepID=A0AAV7VM26_PLEWA|nr:hypothetical protein NDU88_005740 [Pleurodeles waltl]